MASTRTSMSKEHALKLCIVQHKYAAQIAAHASALECHEPTLLRLHSEINAKAIAIAGADFADHHTLGFYEYQSIAEQQVDNEGGCSVEGAGIVNVIDMANTIDDQSR